MDSDTITPPCNARVCPHKMAFMLDNWVRRLVQNPQRILGAYIRTGDTVVDIGCGPGFFTVAMARMVGGAGRVVAVDLQEEMLAHVRRKASAGHLDKVIACHRCSKEAIGLDLESGADFVLAYYVVHELPDAARFFDEVKQLLKPGGRCLVAEPRMHVAKSAFEDTLRTAEKAGLTVIGRPKRKGGRCALLALR